MPDEDVAALYRELIVPAIKELRPSFPEERDEYFVPKRLKL